MKRLILDGAWLPGSRIPPYFALEKDFGVSRVTMQQIVARLKDDGFLYSRERQGLFVCPCLPFRHRIGLVLPSTEKNNLFWEQLLREAELVGRELDREFVVFRNISRPFCEGPELECLAYDIRERRLAGLLFSFLPAQCPKPEIFQDKSLPLLTFSNESMTGVCNLRLDNAGLAQRGVDWLRAQGCRRVVLLCRGENSEIAQHYRAAALTGGLFCPPHWQLPVQNEELGAKLAQLLWSLPVAERPDGLFIADDNLTEPVLAGLAAAGARVPQELKILSHCNWRDGLPQELPVRYLGYDIRDIMRQTVALIDRYHLDGLCPGEICIPAFFEEELTR